MLRRRLSLLCLAAIMLVLVSGCSQILDALGMKGSDGADGADGVSVIWKGDLPSAPSSPALNWAYYDTTQMKAFVYDGSAWTTLAVSGVDGTDGADAAELQIRYSSDASTWHTVYASGDVYLQTSTDGGTTWSASALFKGSDGATGEAGTAAPNLRLQYSSDGTNWHTEYTSGDAYLQTSSDGGATWGAAILFKGAAGSDGISIVWQGSLAAAPDPASLNWAYYNTVDKRSYVYDGSAWQTLAQDGSNGQTVYVGEFGDDVYLQYGGQALVKNGGVHGLGEIVLNSGSSHWSFEFTLYNNSAMNLTLSGTPSIKAIAARFDTDTGDTVPEVTVDSTSAQTVKISSPITFNILVDYNTRNSGSFRKRFRIELESDSGDLYNFEFEVEGSLTS